MTRAYAAGTSDDGGRPGARAASPPAAGRLRDQVERARRDPALVLLEGVHALKHAVRFGADIEVVATPDHAAISALLHTLAPDVALPATREVDAGTWAALAPRGLPSPVLAVARRPAPVDAAAVLERGGRVVVLEQPRHLGNLGAVIRVAAAAHAAGVVVVGDADPWHPTAVRGAAGLQFALPVARCEALPPVRPGRLVALDDDGAPLRVRGAADGLVLAEDAVLLVGTERGGLSDALLARADLRAAIPMRPGVASLNLATAVAVALYAG
jgi:RNA methyltransferase, TrmH family